MDIQSFFNKSNYCRNSMVVRALAFGPNGPGFYPRRGDIVVSLSKNI